jgi:SM-20-related protein
LEVIVIDDFLKKSEHEILIDKFSQPIWRYGWDKKGSVFEKPCLHAFLAGKDRRNLVDCYEELRNSEQWEILGDIWLRIKYLIQIDCKLIGVYANGMTHGMETEIHRDNKENNSSKTAVLFIHGYWAPLWAGELIFFNNERSEIIKSVLPQPNRLVIFDGRIPHGVRMPTAICNQLRVSIAFKTHTIEG